ncbi:MULTISPECIES: glycosyltransferase family 2 protein [Limnospira]|uniref:Glycosyl transferase, family 2 n=2 Tax=Limnospira TaxID=2596745 RepID=A0A9P1P140_9CYAN|nr:MULTISPECIES: glycosyltransferase family 2 protein [Limnospira]EKD06435.1 glycosyl transferase family 2 [Arthrospira platensis C1]MDT9188575.1 glycosyltransferase family 2 protein [Limnospira sp. PMC 894.15]MDT9234393.1 glycosyltransferase family 2 protein [Limnospira sp. PMC 917.15]MDT9275275.1 glycosyltransferase family 2 protein [Limnospira sp. PMC 737.11]UWU48470.1 Glycosyltransferase, GT2 family [Arthrospira platensis C1]
MAKITVCIPTYNRVKLLPIAIASVLEQTEQDFELIVCDDGSTDGTVEIMSRYEDPRLRYIRHQKNIGKSNNMRSGFDAATGEYFIKFDDDDRLTPEFLEKTSAILEQNPTVDFVGTDHWIIDINNNRDQTATDINSVKWGRSQLPEGIVENLLEVVFIQQSFQIGATLCRRQALIDVGYMRPNIQNCEDNDLLVRLALAGKQGYYIPQRLMEYRVHAEQQGLNRAIPYLRDQITYLENFQFPSEKLETIRRSRLAESQLLLGLRMVETGDTQAGRVLIVAGQSASLPKAWTGLAISVLPQPVRKQIFTLLRRAKS